MKKWPNVLTNGNTIGIFAPSEPLWDHRRKKVLEGEALLHESGFKVRQSSNLFAEHYDSAGNVEQRLDDLIELLTDPSVHCLGGAWGGKSANELLEKLDYDLCLKAQKPIFGFSDVAVLLNAITARTGLITYFGPNVVGKLNESKNYDLILIKDPNHGKGKNPFLVNAEVNLWNTIIPGDGEGRLFGGNLSTFVLGLTGTRYMEKMDDCIFFWESAGETPQIIKQHLTCLKNAGFFKKLQAMIVGDVHWPSDGYEHQPVKDVITEVIGDLDIPVFNCPTFGHVQLPNPIIPIGALMKVSEDYKYSVLF